MGNLTDDMTRLRGEVLALRGARGALMQDLTRGSKDLSTAVAAMRADFTSAHAAMAKQARGEREAFVAALISEVNSLLGAFSQDREDMARLGTHDRGIFLSEMRREVTGMCKEMADDLMGARLAWRGRSPGKSQPVLTKKEPVVVKPISPPAKATLKKTVAEPEFKVEKPPVTFKEPLEKDEGKKTVVAPDIETEKPPVTFKEQLKNEEEKKTVATVEPPADEPPKVKTLSPVFAAPEVAKQKEKSWLEKTRAKSATKGKRGKK